MTPEQKEESAARFLISLGYSEAEVRKWLHGPVRELPPSQPLGSPPMRHFGRSTLLRMRTVADDGSAESHDYPPPPLNPGELSAGVTSHDLAYWVEALNHPEIAEELRSTYLRNLRAAVAAIETPSVTPEDIAYWLGALRDPALPQTLRATYRRNAREALRRYHLDEEEPEHDR